MDIAQMNADAGGWEWEPPSVEDAAALFPGYELIQLIGLGGMGAVYQARQVGLDRLVAIKLLPVEVSAQLDFAECFRREARIMARLHHPNIIAVHDFGQTGDGHLFFVMEYVEGENLHQIIQRAGLDVDAAISIIVQICNALSYAHANGIVHGDIKPSNMMIDAAGQVKVADFGLARLTEPGAEQASPAMGRVPMGTPGYAAPEQVRNLEVDHRADIFALGAVFYELLCQEAPSGSFLLPSVRVGSDVRIDAIIVRAMQEKPKLRYQSAEEMKAEMEKARATQPGNTDGAGGRPVPGRRRVPVRSAASDARQTNLWIGVGTAVVAVIVYFAMQPKSPTTTTPPAVVEVEPEQATPTKVKPDPGAAGASKSPSVDKKPAPISQKTEPKPPAATPGPKAPSVAAKWLAEQEPQWQEAFRLEVTTPFERGVGELKREYLATLDSQLAGITPGGQPDGASALRDELKRFAETGKIPPTDDPDIPAVLGTMRANYRKSFAALESSRDSMAKTVAARYDAILARNQLLLTQNQRLDEAIEVKAKREQLAADWLKTPAQ